MNKLFGYDVVLCILFGVIFGHEFTEAASPNFTASVAGLGLIVYFIKAILIFIKSNEDLFE